MFGLGVPEILLFLAILLLLFGNRLPSVMRSMGQGITEFKKGIKDDETTDNANISRSQED